MVAITIIIPMYNSGKSIIRCLKSISKQSFHDFDVLIIDDGSTDNSTKIVSRYLEKDTFLGNRTQVIIKDNSGVANTRNYGITLAEGKYISFIDQDDFITRSYLENYYMAAIGSDADIVVGGYERVSSSGRILSRRVTRDNKWCIFPNIMPWAHLYKKEFLINNKIEFLDNNIGEDIYFNVIAYQIATTIKIIPDVGYKWYFNEESVSNTLHTSLDCGFDELRLYESLYSKLEELGKENGEYIEYFFLRSICHNFLYSVRKSSYDSILKEYKTIFGWLEKHYPLYNKKLLIRQPKPRGEQISFYMCVVLFYSLDRIKLLKPCLKILSK